MPPVPDKWAVVVRVSHMGARRSGAEDFHSERDQIAAAEEAIRARGGQAVVLPSELDVSGGLSLAERPSLLKAVEGVERGEFRGIAVAYQSRLSRNPGEEEQVWQRVEAAGGEILIALEPLNAATVDGRMIRRFRSAINAAERDRHAERFEHLREVATKAGIWQRRQTPKGYERDPDTRKLRLSADAGVVHRAFRDRAAGATISEIARYLKMSDSGARQLLRNRVYLGELRVGEHLNPTAHDELVTIEEFEAAQVDIPRPARKAGRAPALLAGLVRCQACGHVMSRTRTTTEVYAHPQSSNARDCPEKAAVTVALLDALVERVAVAELSRLAVTATEGESGVKGARDRLAAAKRELETFLLAVSAEDVGPDAFAAAARERRQRVDAATDDLRHAMAMRPALPSYGATGADIWAELTAHERNQLLRGLVEVVVVRRAGGRGARVVLEDRVRVVRHGAGVLPFTGRGAGRTGGVGVRPIPWLDVDHEDVLRVPGVEDGL